MIHLITSGVQGLKEAQEHTLKLFPDYFHWHDLTNFVHPDGMPPITGPGVIAITMTFPYDREDLKTHTLFESKVFAELHREVYDYLSLLPAEVTCLLFAHEHGLGFVPMITAHREQIKRETELLAKIMPLVHSYKIMFAGNVPLTVFERP